MAVKRAKNIENSHRDCPGRGVRASIGPDSAQAKPGRVGMPWSGLQTRARRSQTTVVSC